MGMHDVARSRESTNRLLSILEDLQRHGPATEADTGTKLSLPSLTDPPEAEDVSFKLNDKKKIAVTIATNDGEPIQFTIAIDTFLTSITSAVMFANLHLAQVFDVIGVP